VVTVTRIDRPARSTFDLFGIVKQIVDAKAQFRSLAEPWADTGTSTRRLMIAVLGGLADVERDLIRTRTAEGRSRAQKRRQRLGRPPKLTATQQAEARRRRAEGATGWNSNEWIGPDREGRRKSCSHRTRRWREMDSNPRFPVRWPTVETLPPLTALACVGAVARGTGIGAGGTLSAICRRK
jgi:DNA invertase Pin-like site-specific DNA recombinase